MLRSLFLFARQLVLGFGFFSINVLCKMDPSNVLKPYPLLLNIRMQIVRSALQTKCMPGKLFPGSKNSNVGQECHVKYIKAKLIKNANGDPIPQMLCLWKEIHQKQSSLDEMKRETFKREFLLYSWCLSSLQPPPSTPPISSDLTQAYYYSGKGKKDQNQLVYWETSFAL